MAAVTRPSGLPAGKLCARFMPVVSAVWCNSGAVRCLCKVMPGADIDGDGKGALLSCANYIGTFVFLF